MNNLMPINLQTDLALQEQTRQYLTFLVGDESFAVSILDVKEIIEVANVTRVPLTPDFIYGVINLRGNVVPVVDLSSRLRNHKAVISKYSCIVLVAVEASEGLQLIGMLVDEVKEILEIPPADIRPAPDFGVDIRTDFIQAMARVDEVFIILLALNRVLSLAELSQLQHLKQEQDPAHARGGGPSGRARPRPIRSTSS